MKRVLNVLLVLFLVPAVLLTLVRLLDPHLGIAIQMGAFTPVALPLYAGALLVLVVRRVLLPVRAALGLVTLAGLVLHGWWLAPMYLGSTPDAAEGAEPLTVMTANLRLGEAEGFDVVETASAEDVDVLALQEVTPALLATMDSAGLGELFPYRAGEAKPGATGSMILAKEEITGVTPLATTHDSWSVRVGGLHVFAVHPAYPLHPEQWRRDLAALATSLETARPDLVLGDFNASLDHAPMRDLLDAGYRDAAEATNAGWQPTWPDGHFSYFGVPLPTSVAIDHVITRDSLSALRTWTAPIEGSDHRAVLAEVAPRR